MFFLVPAAVKPNEHRPVRFDAAQQIAELSACVFPQQLVLVEHQVQLVYAVQTRGKMIVPK